MGGGDAHGLAEAMTQVVNRSAPLTWAELAECVGESTSSVAMIRASRQRVFVQQVIVAAPSGKVDRPPDSALVFRADQLDRVAASGRLWRLALSYLRVNGTHMHTAAELKAAFRPAALKSAFGASLRAALATRTLPSGVGAVLRRGHFYLLLQDDLLTPPQRAEGLPARSEATDGLPARSEATDGLPARSEATDGLSARSEATDGLSARSEAPPSPGGAPFATGARTDGRSFATGGRSDARPFETAFEAAFDALDAESGRRNFVKLLHLRRALPQFPRAVFDHELNALRRAGRFSLDAAEGTHDRTTPQERDAGIVETGRRLVYCARR